MALSILVILVISALTCLAGLISVENVSSFSPVSQSIRQLANSITSGHSSRLTVWFKIKPVVSQSKINAFIFSNPNFCRFPIGVDVFVVIVVPRETLEKLHDGFQVFARWLLTALQFCGQLRALFSIDWRSLIP